MAPSSPKTEGVPRATLLLALGAMCLMAACSKPSGGGTGGGTGHGDGLGKGTAENRPLRVAAAADLQFAFRAIGSAFEAETGRKVEFSFGSTGLLAKQIREGAPFDVFAAANETFADEAIRSGECLASTKYVYAEGRIVIWSNDPNRKPPTLDAIGANGKLGMANPDHAPYGRAAEQAMRKAGVWERSKANIVFGENVQQALKYAQTGDTDVSIVALSLAIVSGGSYTEIDPSMHEPLRQALVVCKGGARGSAVEGAKAFADFVGNAEGRSVMKKFGFRLPSEPRLR